MADVNMAAWDGRLGRMDWRRIPSDAARTRYADLHHRLGEGPMRTARERASALNLVYYFMLRFNDGIADLAHPADLGTLNHFAEGEERARRAWEELVQRNRWGPAYLRDARTKLSRALAVAHEPLACVVNPVMRRAHRSDVVFENRRAQTHTFSLHECVPIAVRRCGTGCLPYRLLCDLGRDLATHLRGASQANLRAVLLFVNAMLFGPRAAALWPADSVPCDVRACRADLRRLRARDWLERYGRVFAADRRISFDLFRREMRLLSLLHGEVLRDHRETGFVGVPIPKANWWRNDGTAPAADGAGSGASTLNSCAGSSEQEQASRAHRQEVRDAVAALRGAHCRALGDADERPLTTFTPDEVRRIIAAAETPFERLVVLLFVATGLRRGGLSLLRLPGAPHPRHASEVPRVAHTVEKNGKPRDVNLSTTLRVLVARWYASAERAGVQSPWLFPGRETGRPTSRARLWVVCRTVFRRAGMTTAGGSRMLPHAHPHTFRHTTVKMLWMLKNSWEDIAKWLGPGPVAHRSRGGSRRRHASPKITSTVYGRLTVAELHTRLRADFLDDDGAADAEADAWRDLARHLARPYPIAVSEEPTPDGGGGRRAAAPPPPDTREAAKRLRRDAAGNP